MKDSDFKYLKYKTPRFKADIDPVEKCQLLNFLLIITNVITLVLLVGY